MSAVDVTKYLETVATYLKDPASSEMSYRSGFQNLLETIFPKSEKYHIQHDPKATAGNKPDFIILNNNVPLLYIEVKKVGEDLDKIEKSSQASRYFGYANLIISDYVSFRFYRNGQKYDETIDLGTLDLKDREIHFNEGNKERLVRTIMDFTLSNKEPIKSGKHLAKIMGGKAQRIRDNIVAFLESETVGNMELKKMMTVLKENLVADIDIPKFADMYAQTLVYGLFAARYNDKTADTFSRQEARELIPATNPFLQHFFDHITGATFPKRLDTIVTELCEVFSHADVKSLMREYFKTKDLFGKTHESPDPVIHFYEDFLLEYDPSKKIEMGVFYTPLPVVRFIVRSIDEILKKEFGITKGLADNQKISKEVVEINDKGKAIKTKKDFHKVQILDVATGTGTFLNEVIQHIYGTFTGREGVWKSYVETSLIPRLHGFELMMASYTVAHLKLGMTLQNTGIKDIKERLGVYLTNTLEEATIHSKQASFFGFLDSIATESKEASKIKRESPIMVVIGNPPYSGISQNKHYTENSVYKVEPGGKEKLKEKKNWLDDDYVKFIRFAETLVEKNQEGVVGMITSHGYIDNPTFRGMRWHLRNTFDSIYVLDLHGNSNKKEVSPDGSKDENVFDIKTGVSIFFGIKKSPTVKGKKLATVYHSEFYGLRADKSATLDKSNIENIKWTKLSDEIDAWKLEGEGKDEYKKGFSVAELFPKNTTGIVTARDGFVIDQDREVLLERINTFCDERKTDQEVRSLFFGHKKEGKYKPGDSRGWKLDLARKRIRDFDHESLIQSISYRPFDTRYIYYSPDMVDWGRWDLASHLMGKKNVGFVLMRQATDDTDFNHVIVSENMVDNRFMYSGKGITLEMPLYLYPETDGKNPNIGKDLWKKINDVAGDTTPEDILDYVYAYLYSPSYREQYKEFLKTDFPRVPFPKTRDEFWNLVPLGTRLRGLHLLTDKVFQRPTTTYPVSGSNLVEKISYKDGKVYINAQQYFGDVPEVAWNFYIGGYQPAQKYLKDRKSRELTNIEIEQYEKIIISLTETDMVMKEIDKVIK